MNVSKMWVIVDVTTNAETMGKIKGSKQQSIVCSLRYALKW